MMLQTYEVILVWHATTSLIFFTLLASQMIRHKLTNSANRKGIELGFHANTWRLNFAS